MAWKVRERKTKMNEGLHYYKAQVQKIEHISQKKVKWKLVCSIFLKIKNCIPNTTPKCVFHDFEHLRLMS
jgi:hypothetical protein